MEYFEKVEERVVLVGVQTGDENIHESLDELEELAQTAGAQTVGKIIQNREAIHPGTYIGKGKIEEVRSAMVAAMKAGDKERKAALSFLLSSLKNKAIDKRADLTEEEENQVILKEIKQLKETIDMTPAGRTDLLDEAEKRLSVLEEYAPKMMNEDEIRAVISEVLSGLDIEKPLPKDKGRIMKELMPKVKGKADGKLVNELVAGFMK